MNLQTDLLQSSTALPIELRSVCFRGPWQTSAQGELSLQGVQPFRRHTPVEGELEAAPVQLQVAAEERQVAAELPLLWRRYPQVELLPVAARFSVQALARLVGVPELLWLRESLEQGGPLREAAVQQPERAAPGFPAVLGFLALRCTLRM
jgi:hypothetical protein